MGRGTQAQSVYHGYGKHEPDSPPQDRIRLADFIRASTPQIVCEWEAFARTLTPAASHMTPLALRDHIHELLAFITNDMESSQTDIEQVKKSHGLKESNVSPNVAETHA